MAIAKISSKNQIVIPREARESLGVKAGDSVIVVPSGNGAYLLKKPRNFAKAIRGIAIGLYEPDYLQKERQNWSKLDSSTTSRATNESPSTPASSSTTAKKTRATSSSRK